MILLGAIVLAVYLAATVAGIAARSRARMIRMCGAEALKRIRLNGGR